MSFMARAGAPGPLIRQSFANEKTAGASTVGESAPPRGRDPDPDDLDRLASSHHHLALRRGKPGFDKTVQQSPVEVVDEDEQPSVYAVGTASEQLQRSATFRSDTRSRHPQDSQGPPSPRRLFDLRVAPFEGGLGFIESAAHPLIGVASPVRPVKTSATSSAEDLIPIDAADAGFVVDDGVVGFAPVELRQSFDAGRRAAFAEDEGHPDRFFKAGHRGDSIPGRTGAGLGAAIRRLSAGPSRLSASRLLTLTEGAGITPPPRREGSGRHHRYQPC